MSGRRPEPTDNLLLIAATTVLILTAQRYFQANPPRMSAIIVLFGRAEFGDRTPDRAGNRGWHPGPRGVRGAVVTHAPGPTVPGVPKEH